MLRWFSVISEIGRLIGRSFRGWSEWAQKNPRAAADQLELVSKVLEHRARAYKRPNGWRARRDRAAAAALVDHANELRARSGAALQRVCAVRPGEYR